jgi:hypothetical protein
MIKIVHFLSSVLLLCTATASYAGVIGLRTTKAVGGDFTLAVNAGVTADLKWSDGTEQQFVSDGLPRTVTVKADSLTISSADDITMLYVPDDGLTSLNVTGVAATLAKLLCSGNSLTALKLSANKALEELDCQNNLLTSLDVRSCTLLSRLNCAQNQLTTLSYVTVPKFQTLVCADNQLDGLTSTARMTALQGLICQNNRIATLDLSKSPDLHTLIATSNGLSKLTLGSLPVLTDIWVGDNKLDTLDLSTACMLQSTVADHNNLNLIRWTNLCKESLKYLYINDNALFFNSFPTIYSTATTAYTLTGEVVPQRPYQILPNIATGTQHYLMNELTRNGWNYPNAPTVSVKNATGTELALSTDYTNNAQTYTFLTEQEGCFIYRYIHPLSEHYVDYCTL